MKSIQKFDPNKLFIMYIEGIIPYQFVHRWFEDKNPVYALKRTFEGCAIMTEAEVNETIKRMPNLKFKVRTVADMSAELPITVTFPKGHELETAKIIVRAINGPANIRDLIKTIHK